MSVMVLPHSHSFLFPFSKGFFQIWRLPRTAARSISETVHSAAQFLLEINIEKLTLHTSNFQTHIAKEFNLILCSFTILLKNLDFYYINDIQQFRKRHKV